MSLNNKENKQKNNILAVVNPQLSSEWHPTKNHNLTPEDVTVGSHREVWWLGKCGHEWEAEINARNRGQNCPYCANKRILVGFNDLQTTNPLLAAEWHPTKNGSLKPTDVTAGSGKKVWWKCPVCGNEWPAEISSRNKGRGCPKCAFAYGTSFPEQAIYYYVQRVFPDAENRNEQFGVELDVYIPSKKTAIEYDGLNWHHDKLEQDNAKDLLCNDLGIALIRIREEALPITQSAHNIYRYGKDSIPELEKCIQEILTFVGDVSDDFDIDINRDRNDIIAKNIAAIKNRSLQAKRPDLAEEWNQGKNGLLKPSMVLYGAHIKVWWKCSKCGHEWSTTVKHRCNGHGCPKCAGKLKSKLVQQTKLRNGERSLRTLNPELAKELHPTKNGDLTPNTVNATSRMKVWWLGKCGHEWEAAIDNRHRNGTDCPYCSGKKVLAGFNDVQTVNPTLALEWHPTKNGDLKPTDVSAGSKKKVWWKCSKCGHEWQATINNRNTRSGCPHCAGRKSHYDRLDNLQIENPTLAKQWHPTKNGLLKPTGITAGSSKKVWWLGNCGHEWQASVNNRNRGGGCPYCSGKKILKGFNDLQTINPSLAKEWHPTKNAPLKAFDVVAGSNKRVWWKCPVCGGEWQAKVQDRNRGDGCPYCSGKKILKGFNDLQTINPSLAKEWHPTKNGLLKPSDVTAGTRKKVWWLCPVCGREWKAEIGNRNRGSGCPKCHGKVVKKVNEQETQRKSKIKNCPSRYYKIGVIIYKMNYCLQRGEDYTMQ